MKELLRKAGIPLAILVFAVVAAGTMISAKKPPEQTEVEVKPFLVDAVTASKEDIRFRVLSQGTVMPRVQTVVSAQVSGKVVNLNPVFNEGGMFKQGDILLTLEQDDYITDLKAAEAELARAQAALEEELARGKVAEEEWRTVTSDVAPALGLRKPQLAKEQANLRAAQANLERAQRNLSRTQIYAPYDGIVKSQDVDLGEFVAVGQRVAEVYATDLAEIRMPITDHDLAYLELPENGSGVAPVELTATVAGKHQRWTGQLVRNEGMLDPERRVIYGVAEVTDPYLREPNAEGIPLKFGRFVQASISGNKASDLVVLPRSVLRLDGTVLIVGEDRKLEIRKVEVLRADEKFIYVSEGIAAAELVAVSSVPTPYNGMPVRLPNDLPAPEDAEENNTVIAASGGEQ